MKITKVTYQKTYSIGPYLTDKVGMEAEPEGEETVADVLDNLRGKSDEWHKAEHPHLYQESKERWIPGSEFPEHMKTKITFGPPPVIDLQAIRDKEQLEDAILAANSLQSLAEIKEACGKSGLISQYMKRLNELMVKQ